MLQKLTEAQRFEREYLLAVVDRNLFWLERAEWPRRNPTFYFDWNLDFLSPDPYLTKPYAPLEVRLRDFTSWLSNVPAATAQIQANLRTPMPRTWIDQGVASFGGMVPFLRDDAPQVFAEVKDEALQKAYADASAKAIAAFKTLADWLQAQRATADRGLCHRRRTLRRHAEGNRGRRRAARRLLEAGKADLERNLAALDEACKEFAPGRDRKGCMEKMNANRPRRRRGRGRPQAARRAARLRRRAQDRHHPVGRPDPGRPGAAVPGDELRLHQPGRPYDTGMPSTYYIAPPDPSWPKAEQDAYMPGVADLLSTSVHEVWPGHFLQSLHSNRSDEPHRAAVRGLRVRRGLGALRGGDDVGSRAHGELAGGRAEYHVGQLNNALLRNVRYLCAIGLHTQGMTVEECERMFREQAFQDPGNARQQAARGTYDPAYLNYTLGKLMIRKLRDDWTATRGGREAWGEFHDAFLSFGGPPVPLVREGDARRCRGSGALTCRR